MKRLSLLLLAALFVPAVAMAEHEAGHGTLAKDAVKAKAKAEIDTNGDGLVSKAEFMAHQEKRFAAMDADGDGSVSDAEHKASMEKWKSKRDEWRAKLKEKGAEASDKDAPPPAPAE